jgi:ubiquinone/menaquinone biosynthesis C-methylase UbiE
MGLIFDKRIAEIYRSWQRSPQGRAIERMVEQLMVRLLDPRPGQRVLDIGCGFGNHLLIFGKLGLDLSGIDASPHMVHQAKKRLGHCCDLKTGFAEDLPFDDNEFDLAVMIGTLEFVEDPLRALREAGRVASRKVFVGVTNSFSWNGLGAKLKGYLGHPLFGKAKLYNLWEIKTLLQMAYGPAPLSWEGIRALPLFLEDRTYVTKTLSAWDHSPFAHFLGLSVAMIYRVKSDGLPLKVKIKKASQSLIGASTLEEYNRSREVRQNERGLPV